MRFSCIGKEVITISQLTPDQIELVKQAVEQAVQQQMAEGNLSNQVNAQQLQLQLLGAFNQLPTLVTSLATTPVNILTSIIGNLVQILTGILGVTGIVGGGLAPNLVNIIKKEIPIVNNQENQ